MIYILSAFTVFTFLATCGACSRLKKAEEHIEILRAALDRHLTDGADYINETERAYEEAAFAHLNGRGVS